MKTGLNAFDACLVEKSSKIRQSGQFLLVSVFTPRNDSSHFMKLDPLPSLYDIK